MTVDRLLRLRWALVPALAAVGALVGLLIALLGSSQHRAEAAVLVSSKQGVGAVRPLLGNVRELASSNVLAGNVRSTLRLSGSDERLRDRLHATVRPDSQVIVLSVSDSNADRARQIAQEAAVVLTQLVSSRFGAATPPLQARILDSAHVVSGAERHVARDTLFGAALGGVVALAVLAAVGSRRALPADTASAERALRERETLLGRRLKEVEKRESALARHAGQLAMRERALETAGTPAAEPAAAASPAGAAPTPTPAPPPEPIAPAPPPAGPVAAAPSGDAWNLNQLERLVAAHPDAPPERVEEWRTYLFFLREHVGLDGTLPPSFDGLVADVFGDLLDE